MAIKVASCTQQVQPRLPIVAFVGSIYICADESEDLGAELVPFELCVFGTESRFAKNRVIASLALPSTGGAAT